MCPLFDQLAPVEHEDAIAMNDRREAVRDRDDGLVVCELATESFAPCSLQIEASDHRLRLEVFFDGDRDDANLFFQRVRQLVRRGLEALGEPERDQEADDREERETPLEPEEERDAEHERAGGLQDRRQIPDEGVLDRREIGGEARDDVSDLRPRVEVRRELLQMGKEAEPHRVHDGDARARVREILDEARDRRDAGAGGERDEDDEEHPHVVRNDRVVDERLEQKRDDRRVREIDEHRDDDEQRRRLVRREVRDDRAEKADDAHVLRGVVDARGRALGVGGAHRRGREYAMGSVGACSGARPFAEMRMAPARGGPQAYAYEVEIAVSWQP